MHECLTRCIEQVNGVMSGEMNKIHQIYPTEKKMQEPDRQKVRGYKQILLDTKALRRRRNLSYPAIQHVPELVNSNIVY